MKTNVRVKHGAALPATKKAPTSGKRKRETKRKFHSEASLRIMPDGLITAPYIPGECLCKWDYHERKGKWSLKFFNMACPLLRKDRTHVVES